MRKAIAMVAVSAVAALSLAACGAAPEEKAGGGNAAASDFKACMVSDAGGFDDKSFNESGYNGLKKAEKDLGVKIQTYESSGEADFTPNLDAAVGDGCKLVIGVGFLLAPKVAEAAAKHPDVHFAIVDSATEKPMDNVKPLLFATQEAGYLAGYVAAGMTKTGKVGTFLGMAIPSTQIFADGFADGIAKYNEVKGKHVELLGWDKATQKGNEAGTFDDIAKGQQLSETLYDQGADIVMPVAGPLGSGTLAAAKAKGPGHLVIWVDSDGAEQPANADSKNIILTSVMKEIANAVFDTVKESSEGKFSATPYVGTIANGGVGIAPFHDLDSQVPQELKDEVKKLQEQIKNGEIKVESPSDPRNAK